MLDSPHLLHDCAYLLLDEGEVFSYNIYTERDLSFLARSVIGSMSVTISIPLNLLILLGHFAACVSFYRHSKTSLRLQNLY